MKTAGLSEWVRGSIDLPPPVFSDRPPPPQFLVFLGLNEEATPVSGIIVPINEPNISSLLLIILVSEMCYLELYVSMPFIP